MSERERFEVEFRKHWPARGDQTIGSTVWVNHTDDLDDWESPRYLIDETQKCWMLWQAAAAERDAALRQVAVLREALDEATEFLRDYDVQRQAQRRYQSLVTDTEAAAKEYEREFRNRVLEEAAAECARMTTYGTAGYYAHQNVERAAAAIRAMKETP